MSRIASLFRGLLPSMTEKRWLACTDPLKLLRHLRGTISDRKSRLLCCALCRRVWHLLPDQRSRWSVEVAEEFADGRADATVLAEAFQDARALAEAHMMRHDERRAWPWHIFWAIR